MGLIGESATVRDIAKGSLARQDQMARNLNSATHDVCVRCVAERASEPAREMRLAEIDQARKIRHANWGVNM
jgi:hypothetical protein